MTGKGSPGFVEKTLGRSVWISPQPVSKNKVARDALLDTLRDAGETLGCLYQLKIVLVNDEHLEFEQQSFIVKVWLEPAEQRSGRKKWRGRITHVGTNERRYFQHLKDIAPFIERYMIAMGVQPSDPGKQGNA